MKLTLLTMTLLISLATCKLHVIKDKQEIAALLRAIKAGDYSQKRKMSQNFKAKSHMEEAEEGTEEPTTEAENEDDDDGPGFYPVTCDYAGETRFGFYDNGDDKEYLMLPEEIRDCENPADLRKEISHVVPLSSKILTIQTEEEQREAIEKAMEENGGDCNGLNYTFKRDDEEVDTVLHFVSTQRESNEMPQITPGYITMESLRVKMYMYETVYNYRAWMGDLFIFCLK